MRDDEKPTVDVWRYLPEYEVERADILAAVDKVFSSGKLILGDSVRAFEAAFAAYCGVGHAVGVDNGTNAISLALRAVGVREGDDVITVSNTAAPTVVAIQAVGARARFVDIDPASYLMDVSRLEDALTPRTTCIVPVHLFGQCVDMAAVNDIAKRRGLRVVEDCAQAHGALFAGKKAGSMSDAAAFSFYPTKVLGAYGDGGMVVTDDPEVDARLRRFRQYGMDERGYVVGPGQNSRLDEVQAEILVRKLRRIEQYIERRRSLAARYAALLSGTRLTLPQELPARRHVYYLFVVRHPHRDVVLETLAKRDVRLNVSYRWPVHTMTGFAHLGYSAGDLPVTERAASEIFSLPMYASLTDELQASACARILEVVS